MAGFSRICNGTQCQDGQDAFQQHAAISNRFRICFLIQLFGCGSGGNQRMEPGNCATGNGCKQNGKHVLYSVTIVHCESCKGREQLRIDIGMRAHNAYKRNKKHCIQQERTQIVTGLQQNPYRRHRRDGNINTHDNHPCIGGQIQRMEIHTHCHNCNDGHNTQHRGNCHGRVSAVYAEAKYNGNQDK